jgi:hypothetical protein
VTIVGAEQLGSVMLERVAELFDEYRGSGTRLGSRCAVCVVSEQIMTTSM